MSNENEKFPAPNSRMCLWYYKGATNLEPRIAIVTSSKKGGVLDLTIFARNTTRITTASGVRHKDDPYHIQSPTHAKECGCWDYLLGESSAITEEEQPRRGPGRPPKVHQEV